MAPSNKFWDKIAEKYSKQPVADEAAYQRKLQITREYLHPDMRLIEIGCGTGSTAIAQAPYVEHIHATDISPNMIAIAKRKAVEANIRNVTFETETIDGIAAVDQSVDAVMAHSLLHLLEDKEAAIAKIYRMLKPGGVFVSSTVCLRDTMWWFSLIAPIGKALGFMPLVKVFDKKDLEQSLEGAGFQIDYNWQPDKSISVFLVAKKPK